MRRLLIVLFLFSLNAFGYASYSGWCENGGVKVTVQGLSSPLTFQQSFPNLKQSADGPNVTVYATGTTDKATLYSDNDGTPLNNPFPCSSTGQYQFFSTNSVVDLLFSGSGISAFTRSAIAVTDGCPTNSTCDGSYKTLAAACTAAGTGTLYLTRTWSGLTTQTLACNIYALANGIIKPASGQAVTLSGSFSGAQTQHFDTSLGSVIVSGPTLSIPVQWLGAVGDGSTDNTTAISRALVVGMASSKPISFPATANSYLACGASVSGTGPVAIEGDGKFLSTIKPYGGADACTTALTITTTGDVSLHDFGCQYGYVHVSGPIVPSSCIVVTGPGATNAQTPPNSVDIENMYFSQAKSVGLQCSPCQHVTYAHNVSYKNYFFAASFSGTGTVASPTYTHGFNIHDNLSIDESIGIGLNFFMSDISVTGNVFIQSNLSLVQTPHAYATIEGNVFDGVPDNGCYFDGTCGTISGSWYAMFLEGPGDVSVGQNYFSNINGSAGVFNASGSNLSIGGTDMALPTNNLHVNGLVIENSTAGFPLLVNTASTTFGGSPVTDGGNIKIENSKLTNVNQCIVMSAATSFRLANNSCEIAKNGGYTLSGDQNGTVLGNTGHNVSTAGGTTYTAGTVAGSSGSATITGTGTTFVSGMAGGSFTALGTVYQICTFTSTTSITLCTPLVTALSGSSYSIFYGATTSHPGILISGTAIYNVYVAANSFKNDSGTSLSYGINDTTGLTAAQSRITYDATNNCSPSTSCTGGIYNPAPTVTPTLTSCGTSPTMGTGSTNASGQFVPGTGSPTSCTLTFAGGGFNIPGGTSGPVCVFIPSATGFSITRNASSASAYTIDSSAAMSGLIQYQCSAPQGQADQGKYPYPYFWR